MKKRKWFILIMIIVVSVTISGCMMKISESFDENIETESETSVEEGITAKAETQVRDFIKKVNLQDYDGISQIVYMPQNAFVRDEDIKWYIDRSPLADITGIKINNLDIKIDGDAVKKNIAVYINKKGYLVPLVLDKDNNWKIQLPDLYVENWTLKVPKDCSVLVDNTRIDKYKSKVSITDEYDTYLFPAITKKELESVVESSIFGMFKQKITPLMDSETYPLICVLGDAETTNVLRSIQNIWNSLYNDYRNSTEVPALEKYFTSDFDKTEMTNIIFNYFPALETGPRDNTSRENIKYSSFFMKEVVPWTKDNYGAAILATDNSILVNFGYRIDFVSSNGGAYNTNKVSQLTMEYDNTNSVYKIKKVNNSKLFMDNDYTKNDY